MIKKFILIATTLIIVLSLSFTTAYAKSVEIESEVRLVLDQFITNLENGYEEVYDYIEDSNVDLKKGVDKYLGRVSLKYDIVSSSKIDDNTYKVSGMINASGKNWETSGFKIDFTLKSEDGENYIITDTNLFGIIGAENVGKFVFNIFKNIIVSFLIVFVIGILIVILVLNRKKVQRL